VVAADRPLVAGHPWPLFNLRLRTNRLELRLPTDDELVELCQLARAGIHPPESMPFSVPWTDKPSPQFERDFLRFHWNSRASWEPDNWSLDLGVWVDGRLAGTQGLFARNFAVIRTVGTGSWLGRKFQGQRIGREMRAAVLALAFDHLGAEWATSTAFVDNHASASVSRALGYKEDGRDRAAPRGPARELVRYRLTVERWRAGPRPAVEVGGLEAALELFGVES
jgi:RimJ/RimL family protein N-acetyltransferase